MKEEITVAEFEFEKESVPITTKQTPLLMLIIITKHTHTDHSWRR